jgi:hypothetical protein
LRKRHDEAREEQREPSGTIAKKKRQTPSKGKAGRRC